MKTRIIQTRFWDDQFVSDVDIYTQHLYLYLLTCPYINISGVFQLPEKKIMFESKLTSSQFFAAKKILRENKKVLFSNGWVYVVNSMKNNNYTRSPDNKKAYDKEISLVPIEIMEIFDSTVHGSEGTTVGSTLDSDPTVTHIHKQEIINNNISSSLLLSSSLPKFPEGREFDEIAVDYHVPKSFVLSKWDDLQNYCRATGKKYKDYKAALRNWVKKDAVQIRKEEDGRSKIGFVSDPTGKVDSKVPD